MNGIRPKFEEHHQVQIDDEAINAAVKLSSRYISDRFLPDKAIDLIDEAGAKVRIEATENSGTNDKVVTRLKQIEIDKDAAIEALNFEEAAQLRTEEMKLKKKLAIQLFC
ncbi:hypothetical protein BMS81_00620 [Leuconostoc pseudomesenteroides]|nr:hypothetical protein BMS81_00620 [Leuconostoc pseudomesenteroides]